MPSLKSGEKSNYEPASQMSQSEKARYKIYKRQQLLIYAIGLWALISSLVATWSLISDTKSIQQVFHMDNNKLFTGFFKTQKKSNKKNLIFMVSDGMGPASLSLTRSFRQHTLQLPIDDILTLDKHHIGSSRTRSSNSLVTDSAAGATAFSCALKTYNGAIAVHPSDRSPCGTLLEAAKLAGYMTGLVVTTRITDATPAAFSSHANYRFEEDLIAQHQLGNYPLGRVVDLMIGGGRCHFLPTDEGGCRADTRNLVDEAIQNGWSYVPNLDSFKYLDGGNNVTLPLLSLLADYDIPYEIDRKDSEYPSLEETTKTALKALENATKDSDQGFFILIEGSRVDHAGHSNDPAAQVREVMAYDAAFKAAIDFAESSSTETLVISTSDHETGGLAVARQVTKEYPDYLWLPQVLANASHSGEHLARLLANYRGKDVESYIKTEIIQSGLGIYDYTEDEFNLILNNRHNPIDILNKMISIRAQIGWSTHGHSAVDVNIYAYGKKATEALKGNHENTDIGAFMEDYLSLDLHQITSYFRKNKFKTFLEENELVKSTMFQHNSDDILL